MAFFAVHSMALGKNIQMNTHSIDRINHIHCYFDKGMLSCGVFIDLKKAFDTVDHCILLQNCITMALEVLSMIGSVLISLIVSNQLKLVQRFLLNSLRLVVSLKGSCWGLYYSSCTSTIYVDHLINCHFTCLLMILICYMLAEILIHGVDSTIHWINHNPMDNAINFDSTYPLDSDLSGRQRYPPFEQLGPGMVGRQ